MLGTTFPRRRSRLHPGTHAVLTVATVGLITMGAGVSASNTRLWIEAGGRDIAVEAEVEGLPQPSTVGSSARLSSGSAGTAGGHVTGRRVHHPIRVKKRHDEVVSPILSRAHGSGRPLEIRIQGRSASGRLTTWRLHKAVLKTFVCPSDDGGRLPSSGPGGNDVAMEEIVLSAELIELE